MKKLIAMLLALALVFGLVACGGKTEEKAPEAAAPAADGAILAGKTVGFAQTDSMSSWRTTETDSIKASVEAADRKRFEFVNGIVAKVEKRKVEVGINNNVMTEIRSGLEEGEKGVATQMSQSELKDRLATPRSNRRR